MSKTERMPLFNERDTDALAHEYARNIISFGYMAFDAKNRTSNTAIDAVFERMVALSKEQRFHLFDGRPVRFFTISIGSAELADNMRDASVSIQEIITNAALDVPDYHKREFTYFDEKDYWHPKKTATGADGIRNFITSHMSDTPSTYAVLLREVLARFGNPPDYPLDTTGSKQHHETDPAYPSLIPLINIHMDNKPDNPGAFFEKFNKKHALHYDALSNGSIKRENIYTPRELQLARESGSIVSLFNMMFYRSFQLPDTRFAIAAPLFMFDQIAKRYGYSYEAWHGAGPSDTVMNAFHNIRITKTT